jgi:DNA-binding NtrC family response regulator
VTEGQIKILVADDEEVIREACRRILTRAGYEVESASDGQDALDRLDNARFDLILLDIKMPGLDGIKVMEQLKERGPLKKIVVITGHGTVRTEMDARRAGATVFLTKPFTPAELRDAVAQALAGK